MLSLPLGEPEDEISIENDPGEALPSSLRGVQISLGCQYNKPKAKANWKKVQSTAVYGPKGLKRIMMSTCCQW